MRRCARDSSAVPRGGRRAVHAAVPSRTRSSFESDVSASRSSTLAIATRSAPIRLTSWLNCAWRSVIWMFCAAIVPSAENFAIACWTCPIGMLARRARRALLRLARSRAHDVAAESTSDAHRLLGRCGQLVEAVDADGERGVVILEPVRARRERPWSEWRANPASVAAERLCAEDARSGGLRAERHGRRLVGLAAGSLLVGRARVRDPMDHRAADRDGDDGGSGDERDPPDACSGTAARS